MNTYSEQIFQSIDTIISQRLNEVSFDKTEICKIVSQNKDYPERYWVTNEAGLKYEAYSVDENKKYFEGQKIYVTVPQGNYELRKLIIGTYSADEIPKSLYTNPFSQLVVDKEIAMDGTIIAISNDEDYDDWADNQDENKPNNSTALNTSELFPYKSFKEYEYLGFEFAFQTDFNKYQGSYALRIVLCDNNGVELLENNNLIISSKDLYGNPYRLNNTLVFQHLFPWPVVDEKPLDSNLIKSIKLQLIQDNGFYYSQGEDDDSDKEIVLSNAIFKFGYDVDNIKEDKLTLVPKEGQELKYTSGENAISVELFLDWVHIDEDANVYSFNHTSTEDDFLKVFEDYTVFWLHYVDGIGSTQSQELPNNIAWNWEVIDNTHNFTNTITPLTFYNTDQYKVVIKYNYPNDETTYYAVSDAIIFENTLAAPAPGGTSASGESLRLVLLEGNTGVYNIYGLDGKCIDTSYLGPHSITFEFLDGMTKDWIEETTWVFPNESTMINSEETDVTAESTTYKIKSTYNQGAMNNRIQCRVKLKNGEIRTGSLTLQFGEATTGGTNYSLNLDFVGNATCIQPNENVSVKIEFAKANGEEVTNGGEVQTTPQFACGWVGEGEIDLTGNAISLTNRHNISIINYDMQNHILTLQAECSEVPENNYSILYVTAKNYNIDNGLTVDLTAYLPIPIADSGLDHISGATRIVYSMDAKTYSGSKEGYYLYNDDNKSVDANWSLSSSSTEGIPQLRGEITNGKYNSGCSLRPVCYTVDEIPQVCITAYDDNSNALWSQPILIMNNKWQSEAINNWDGSVTINDEEGSIKAPFFIAGRKTADNSFSGVALGNVETEGFNKTGVYGFEEGNLRYALTDAGSFYVGTDSDNFLSFNENVTGRSGREELFVKTNKFKLQSGNFVYEELTQEQAEIATEQLYTYNPTTQVYRQTSYDSTNMNIVYYKRKLNQYDNNYMYISNTANEEGNIFQFQDKFFIKSDGNAKIGGWNINTNSLSYGENNELYFGVANGAILNWGTTSVPDNKSVAFKLGNNFGVTRSGTLYAKDAVIAGEITATSGTIGGCQIKNNVLKIGKANIDEKLTANEVDVSAITAGFATIGQLNTLRLVVDTISSNYITADTLSTNGGVTIHGGNIQANTISVNTIKSGTSGANITFTGNIVCDNINATGTINATGGKIGEVVINKETNGVRLSAANNYVIGITNSSVVMQGDTYGSIAFGSAVNVIGSQIFRAYLSVTNGIGGFGGNWHIKGNFYDTSGAIAIASDINKKNSIENIDNDYELMFNNLRPVTYKYNEGTSNRKHTGFIAQEVKEALDFAKIDTLDFAGLVIENLETENENWYLRYGEFVALNTWQIQKAKARITELETEMANLQSLLREKGVI